MQAEADEQRGRASVPDGSTEATRGRACGWIALEEFQGEKSDRDLGWRGRLDLWLSSAAGSYLIEAKQGWPYLGDATGVNTSAGALNEAHADATNLVLPERALRVGVAFCSPYHQLRSQDQVEDGLHRLLAGVGQQPWDAMAWCFPAATRALVDRDGEEVYPLVCSCWRRSSERIRYDAADPSTTRRRPGSAP